VIFEETFDPPLDDLVVRRRRRGQVELSVDDLVAAVFGQEDVVLVREAERLGNANSPVILLS